MIPLLDRYIFALRPLNSRHLCLWVWCMMLFATSAYSQSAQPSISAQLSKSQILIGDQVQLQLRVYADADIRIAIGLDSLEAVEGIEIVDVKAIVAKQDKEQQYSEQNIILTSFDSGAYVIPSIPVQLVRAGNMQTLYTEPLLLSVSSIPIAGDSLQLAPIKDIYREPFTWQDAWPYLGGLALLLIAGILIWWFWIRKEPAPSMIPPEVYRPAHEIALEKLQQLEQRKLWQQGQLKDYYSELTYIAREYLENRYRLAALESTTGEIVEQMQGLPDIDAPMLDRVRRILNLSDLVKFAKAEPEASFHMEAMAATRAFVEATQQRPVIEETETQSETDIHHPQ